MSVSLENLALGLFSIGESLLRFYHSGFFSFIKFLIGIYTVILLANIIMLLLQRGLSGDVAEHRLGMNIPIELATKKGRTRLRTKWMDKVRSRLSSQDEDDYKIAIIEADAIIDDLLARLKYAGNNMAERLEVIPPGQIEDAPNLGQAHEVRNRIITQEDFSLTKEEAEQTIALYETFLITHFVLD